MHGMIHHQPASVASTIRAATAAAGGWLPFAAFMQLALYAPEGGYYTQAGRVFGRLAGDGSDFITAPELSPLFGQTLAVQIAEALAATQTACVYEFGAGSGALAEQLLDALPAEVHYAILDVSGALRARQQQRLARFGARVRWLDALPPALEGVVVANEVLDAMPVTLLHWDGAQWLERGVVVAGDGFAFADRPTALRPPVAEGFAPGTTVEIHPQAEAFVRTLAAHLRAGRGAALLIDYGFPEAEYYHPQRTGGTLMCHQGHRADADPLVDVGAKDITAHVNFTGVALAAQDAGLPVVGYTSQARFLINCGLVDRLAQADARGRAGAHALMAEHEMGELFKVLMLATDGAYAPLGFASGDRMHRL